MRTLKFIVNKNTITQDPSCDFSGLFPGRNPDVRAEFTFSPEWNNKVKVAAFWSMMDAEYPPQIIDEDNGCIIPAEALSRAAFNIQILGKRRTDSLTTNKFTVRQTGDRR